MDRGLLLDNKILYTLLRLRIILHSDPTVKHDKHSI
jgi:hypothetical protein